MNKIELLAPAGDLEKLKIDVLYGADAVYIGGKALSLRSASTNFTNEELVEAVEFAHSHNCKVYIAFNVYPNDEDKEQIDEYLLYLDQINIDAIIVSSLYVIKRANELKCHFELHVSTQESSANLYTIKFYENYHVSRVVLARELSLEQIRHLKKHTDMEIEVFVHGAMCCSFSGRCTLSNYFTDRDANKGSCSHPCRWDYDLYKDGKCLDNKFLLGSKDLMTIEYIKDLIDAGVYSLKIEGRMKSLNYLAHVVKTYRKLIDDIYQNNVEDLNSYLDEISQSGNRVTTVAWLKGYTDNNDLIYTFSNLPQQNFLGMVLSYDSKTHLALLDSKNVFSVADIVELISFDRETVEFEITRILDPNGNEVKIANNTFFKYRIEVPFLVKEYEILRKKDNK